MDPHPEWDFKPQTPFSKCRNTLEGIDFAVTMVRIFITRFWILQYSLRNVQLLFHK